MEHLVYCDDKEKVLEKIMNGTKTMVVRARPAGRSPIAGCLRVRNFIS